MRAHKRAHRHVARVEYVLPQEAASAGRARKLTSAFLTRPRRHLTEVDSERVDDATLIVSELVANATQHGQSPCRLRLEVSDDKVTVEVHDASPVGPRVLKPSTERDSGRGLAMVRHLSARLEVVGSGRRGKAVRAVLA
ncbi:ATP-binding protein [Streptomyces sp. BA2]|uniref:ATP-binding protein n=1 Tax=Streptomyces sp. BA2 TaxID=436595 RepID=UPI00132BD11A|nr:ATP-binding protein [Streptomyces sp. BA2]MWA08999.1 ATP-binding protein [Streptomyces sp. BA2]